jgi:outer membrane protein assembly factor BamB
MKSCFLFLATCLGGLELSAADWSRFRGPNGAGTSDEKGLPLEWSATSSIIWKAGLPGRGASSPIVWQDRIYVTAYSGYGLTKSDPWSNKDNLLRHLLCVSRKDGSLLWKADHGGVMKEHGICDFLDLHGYASSTPVADVTGVYVYYGNGGVLAYGHDGKLKWHKEFGQKVHSWGSASSPVLFGNLLIVHADIEAQALVAFDKDSGREAWRVPTGDQKFGDSWSTPLLVDLAGKHELVFHRSQGNPATLAALDPRSGEPLWECQVLKDYLCPSPIVHNGVIYTIASQRGAAVRAGGRGNVTQSHVLWNINRGSEVCTPVYCAGYIYWASDQGGIAYCFNASNGAMIYQERLEPSPGRIYASGVLADGRIYYTSREKGTYVVAAKPKFELLAHNVIESDNSIFNGTPAISQHQLFLRSDKNLYCIGTKR